MRVLPRPAAPSAAAAAATAAPRAPFCSAAEEEEEERMVLQVLPFSLPSLLSFPAAGGCGDPRRSLACLLCGGAQVRRGGRERASERERKGLGDSLACSSSSVSAESSTRGDVKVVGRKVEPAQKREEDFVLGEIAKRIGFDGIFADGKVCQAISFCLESFSSSCLCDKEILLLCHPNCKLINSRATFPFLFSPPRAIWPLSNDCSGFLR